MKTELESRISFTKIKLNARKQPVFEASVYWNGRLHETIKVTKELCVEDLKIKAGINQ